MKKMCQERNNEENCHMLTAHIRKYQNLWGKNFVHEILKHLGI